MKIAYFIPDKNTIYAGRTIMHGYKNAFIKEGHEFKIYTKETNQEKFYNEYEPDIIMLGLSRYTLKFLDKKALSEYKKKNKVKTFVNTPFWNSPFGKNRINEGQGLKNDLILKQFISQGFGDIYYNSSKTDERMSGFEKTTGYKHHTIPLAADDTIIFNDYDSKYKADISYLGTNLPGKREFFKETIYPLRKDLDIKFYGQDWTIKDKTLGWIQRGGMYFNIPILKTIQKPKLPLEAERKIYSSSKISINVHEQYQIDFGGDCNERTFKIPLAGGFEIVDNVNCIKDYFVEGKEIVIAKDKDDWIDKINYYSKNLNDRNKIIEAGMKKVKEEHTYKNRVKQIINLYKNR